MIKGKNYAIKLCCISATVIAVITTIVLVTLAFTVFKRHDPDLVLYPTGLAKLQLDDFITQDTITSEMVMSIRNRNHGSFKFENTTSHITYDGELVGWVPILADTIPEQASMNITAYATLRAKKLRENPKAINDIVSGSLNLTATATMRGKMSIMGIKKKGSVYTECHMTMYISEIPIRGDSWCWTKLEI
ncbi:unnamed protein product [Linum tenue]|uniref:Late embryogenesis abundant protein LEA-2 subgroup domain-containing protein n=1 Tax=Linum tenue TaxID=586396 RepID=A0AAV0NPM8_9ROSI|nr:unnamed protein product [Linum tenue]